MKNPISNKSQPQTTLDDAMRPATEALWLFLALAFCSMSGVIFTGLTAAASHRESIQRDAMDAAQAASLVLDPAKHSSVIEQNKMWTEDHKSLLRPLVLLHRSNPELARIRTFSRVGDQIVLVLDTETVAADSGIVRPVDPMEMGTIIPADDATYTTVDSALRSNTATAAPRHEDRPYGTYMPAVYPINSQLAVEALLDIGELRKPLNNTLQAMFLGATLSFAASIAVALIFFNFRSAHIISETIGGEAKRGNEWLQERNRRLVEALGQIALHRMDSGILLWSGDTQTLLGRPADRMPTRFNDWLPMIHDPDRASVTSTIAAATPAKPAFEIEYRINIPGVGLRWFRERGIVEFSPADKSVKSVDSILLDIHDRKSDEENRKALALVVSRTDNAVALVDPTETILWVNPAFESLTGYTPKEATNKKLADLIGTTALVNPEARSPIKSQRKLTRSNGSPYWADLEVVGLDGDDTTELRFVVIQRDISQAKEFEHELVRAKDLAQEADRAKSEFLAVMSHEIRTPLNAVIGFTNLLLKTPLTDVQNDYVDTIKSGGDNLLLLLNDILDFSKTEATEFAIESVPFDPAILLEEALDSVGAAATEKGLELICTSIPGTSQVVGDRSRIRQILHNLIDNAVKFTDHGEVVVKVEQRPTSPDNANIRFTIRDTGQGIDPNQHERLFSPFNLADSSTTRRHGGTGLGLAISKKICEILGGQIGFESTPGEGSTFWFEVPVNADHHTSDPEVLNEVFPGLRALVAVDNPTLLETINTRLRNWGVHVESCQRGRDVIYEATNRRFDFLILDEDLPDVEPDYLVERLRRTSRGSAAAIVLLTTKARDRANPSIPFAQVVHKPIRSENFVSAIAAAAARSHHELTPAESTASPAARPRHQYTRSAPNLDRSQPADSDGSPNITRILVAEDNPINRKLINKMLVSLGHVPDLVTNGVECVQATREKAYDLILMDLQMPEMDGLDATREIRKLGFTLPIIAVTADAMGVDRERCISAGMNDYLPKPIRTDALANVIKKHS